MLHHFCMPAGKKNRAKRQVPNSISAYGNLCIPGPGAHSVPEHVIPRVDWTTRYS